LAKSLQTKKSHATVPLKKEIGEYDDAKCPLICFLNFYELLGVCQNCWRMAGGVGGGGGVELVSVRTHKTSSHKEGNIIFRRIPLFPSLIVFSLGGRQDEGGGGGGPRMDITISDKKICTIF
jgi:hypothetical protein